MLRAPSLLLALLFLAGCGGLDPAMVRDLDLAAETLHGQLDEPGLLSATALLYHTQRGAYPGDAAALLGSAAARETGLQELGLSALALVPSGDDLTIRYTLLPSAADPSDRFGTLTVAETDTVGTYTVDLLLERRADADFGGERLPLTQEGQVAVMRANGSLCADLETVRARGREAGTPPLGASTTYTVTFRPSEGAPASAALTDGITVTLPR